MRPWFLIELSFLHAGLPRKICLPCDWAADHLGFKVACPDGDLGRKIASFSVSALLSFLVQDSWCRIIVPSEEGLGFRVWGCFGFFGHVHQSYLDSGP